MKVANEQFRQRFLECPLGLKIFIGVLVFCGSGLVIHWANGPLHLLVGCGAIALAVNLFYRKKWAWYLAMLVGGWITFVGVELLIPLLTAIPVVVKDVEMSKLVVAGWIAAYFLVGGFIICYLTRSPVRALFGIYCVWPWRVK